ncbi:S-Ena type endospore appendage [Bacillus sp. SM2101]|uniref:DUF3992 domain-containing protein n=1 Tax=Bacillaceae TaxID=186817 RepID=UPI001BDF067B|nr:S-Ena type endospore appendage [Bacillus sp. SM2101]
MSNCCCPDRGDEFFKDELCGNFTIPCGTQEVVIWTTENDAMEFFPVTGSLTVFLDRGCGDLTVELLEGGTTGTVVKTLTITPAMMSNNGNSMSTTQIGFDTVRLSCADDMDTGAACRGKYCLCVNYEAAI